MSIRPSCAPNQSLSTLSRRFIAHIVNRSHDPLLIVDLATREAGASEPSVKVETSRNRYFAFVNDAIKRPTV
jgi:hypothetical protein